MKRLILGLSLVLLYSCEPEIKNDAETLEKIFSMSDFEIEIRHSGCFGDSKEHFSVVKKEEGFLLTSESSGKSHLIPKAKIDSLKNYLKPRIGKEDFGGCTTSEYIRVGTHFSAIDYQHSFCTGFASTIINDLLKYQDLTHYGQGNKL